jgi:paspaline synthase
MLGTVTAGCFFYWRIYFWPERFGYAWTPYGAFLLLASHFFDLLYPFAYIYVQKYGEGSASGLGRNGAAVGSGKKSK